MNTPKDKSEGQAQCIKLLEQVLESAKAGEVTSLAIVAAGEHEFGASFAGHDAAKMNLGLDTLKADIISKITAPQQPKGQSHILQARRMPPAVFRPNGN